MRASSMLTIATLMALCPYSLGRRGGGGGRGGPSGARIASDSDALDASSSSVQIDQTSSDRSASRNGTRGHSDESGSDTEGRGSRSGEGRGSRGGGRHDSSDTGNSTAVCASNGTMAHYEETLSGTGTTMERVVVTETGCPNHVNWKIKRGRARESPAEESIPAYPMLSANGATTDLSEAALSVGIMRNGVALFSSWAGKEPVVDYNTTAFAVKGDSFDLCGGRASSDGVYHYHSTAGCLQEQAIVEAGTAEDEHSPVLGWSFDGFPVYGQLGPGGVEMKMCGEDGADATYCLDVCSGYEGQVAGTDEFVYRYYTSCGFDESFFPFVVNCFRGCCPEGMTCNGYVEACGDSPEEGYTADYVPEAMPSLDDVYDTELIEGDDTLWINNRNATMECSLYLGSEATDGSSSVSPLTGLRAKSSRVSGTKSPATPPAVESPSTSSSVSGTPAPTSGSGRGHGRGRQGNSRSGESNGRGRGE